MNWDRIQGQWAQAAGKAKEQWGRLTDGDLAVVAGRREQLLGKIQERYGVLKEDAEKQLAEWQRQASDAWFPDDKPPRG
ncbi:MAG TPA: CsbD family protein [Methylibium sp.]|nr:CsbD family protein [Methylibium sp.]